jgi:uncharacterized protein
MPQIDAHKPGNFCWMELGTTDPAAAKAFYSRLFGWTSADFPMGADQIYTIFRLADGDVAAEYQLPPDMRQHGVPPHWALYVSVKSADESAAKAASLGGKIMAGPFDIPQMGRMAVLQDPTGVTFSIWEAKGHQGIAIAGEDNAFCWADLVTPDPAGVKGFYEALFGWSIHPGQGPESTYLHIQNGPDFIGGIQPQRNPQAPPHWLVYYQTSDCDGCVEKAKEGGATIFVPPMSLPNVGRLAVLADPQGAVFALFEMQHAA